MTFEDFIDKVTRFGLCHGESLVEFVGVWEGDEIHPSAQAVPIQFVTAVNNGTRKTTIKFLIPRPHHEKTIH